MAALYAKAAPKIADVLRMLYERHRISALARKYGDDARLENKMALELDVILEEVSLCLQVGRPCAAPRPLRLALPAGSPLSARALALAACIRVRLALPGARRL